jgi:hypothetical protein
MSDYFADLECNYKFNILKKRVSITKLIDAMNESISKSIFYMMTNSINPHNN